MLHCADVARAVTVSQGASAAIVMSSTPETWDRDFYFILELAGDSF